jgi:hypothetical protein
MIMRVNECCSETKKNWSWGRLPGDQMKVISLQRLRQPRKYKQ